MPVEVNEALLSNAERSKLHSMQKAASGKASALEWAEAFGQASPADKLRRLPGTMAACVVFLATVALALSWMVSTRASGGVAVALLLGVLVGAVAIGGIAVAETREWARKQIPTYLDSIGYHERNEFAPDRGGGPAYTSARQMRKEWYNDGGPHPELTRRDYDMIQGVFGMSADEWEANKPD